MSAPLWNHQKFAIDETWRRLDGGEDTLIVCSPTGGGKTRIMSETIHEARRRGMRVAIYSHRLMLIEQTARAIIGEGITFGWRRSGRPVNDSQDVQLCSMQTVMSDWKKMRTMPSADLVLVDEAHQQKGPESLEVLGHHLKTAKIVGYTATPVDVWGFYGGMIQAGTNSELRKCGALTYAKTYAPDEPDLKGMKRDSTGEFLKSDVSKRFVHVFGRLWDTWKTLNPNAMPTVGFAPDVASSRRFAHQFHSKGVNAAHISSETISCRGPLGVFKDYEPTTELRDEIRLKSEDGIIPIVWNRYVLREGIDWPHLRHGILATCIGRESTYVQIGGRLLRSFPGLHNVVWQDHGGNYWRHGSLNADRHWHVGDTDNKRRERRIRRLENEEESQPITCPKCSEVRAEGNRCKGCGHKHVKSVRKVVETDGTLRRQYGVPVKKKKIVDKENPQYRWEQIYWRAKNARGSMTFSQARGLYRKEYGEWPPDGLKKMPLAGSAVWNRVVKNTPFHEII